MNRCQAHAFQTKTSKIVEAIRRIAAQSGGHRATKSFPGLLSITLFPLFSLTAVAQPAINQLPTGGVVTAGQAGISQADTSMTVQQQSHRAIVDWQSFSVGSDAQVNYLQPSSSSVILNRVIGGTASEIFGQINANGQVFISNGNGITFAPGASVNVGGLVATTHDIKNQEFMNNSNVFTATGEQGAVLNQGAITVADYAALLAPEVRNQGIIVAQANGTVALASGDTIKLQLSNSGSLLSVDVSLASLKSVIENKGAIEAPGGLIILAASAANQLQSSVIRNDGSLNANSIVERGGRILLEGDSIFLGESSVITATGATGGGEVLVGGDWQGSGSMRQASHVAMAQGASIDVSATDNGDGGTAVLWSDVSDANSTTEFAGTINARGGQNGGKGGQVETSGHSLNVGSAALVDTRAEKGRTGNWLLDPLNFSISAGGAAQTSSGIGATTLNSNLSTNNVTIQTTAAGAEDGDIFVNAAINNFATNNSLTLTAHNNINVNADITVGGGINLLASGSIQSSPSVTFTTNNADVLLASDTDGVGGGRIFYANGLTINSNGGDIILGGGDASGSGYAVGTAGSTAEGIKLNGNTVLNSLGGDISLRGRSFNGVANQFLGFGVGSETAGTLFIDSGTGKILIDGISDSYGTNCYCIGTYFSNAGTTIQSANTGADAIDISGSFNGAFAVTNSAFDWGLEFKSSAGDINLFATGAGGGITLRGDGGTFRDVDVGFLNADVSVLAASGPIQVLGSSEDGVFRITDSSFWGSRAGSPVTTSSSDITMRFDSQLLPNQPNIATNGDFSYLPVGTDFSQVHFTQWFNWNQNGHTMENFTFGSSTATQNLTIDNDIEFTGDFTAYGGVLTLTSNLTNSGDGNILLQGNAVANPSVNVNGNITKTAGTESTLTVKGKSRVTLGGGNTISSSSGALNTIFWSDYDNTKDDGGVSLGNVSTNGGHFWAGGTSTNGGSEIWNGLTVGDGASVGSNNYNYNAIDIYGDISTAGGDIKVWAGSGYSNGIDGIGLNGARAFNSGAGDITLIADDVEGGVITVTSTGVFTFEPNSAGWSGFGGQLDLAGSVSAGTYTGTGDADWLIVNNVSGLTGLNLGKEGNTTSIRTYTPWQINGPINFYANDISINETIASTASGAGILLKATGNISSAADTLFQTNNGDLTFWSDANANGVGHILLGNNNQLNTANGLTNQSTLGGNITLSGGNDLLTGYAQSNTVHGISLGATNTSTTEFYSGGGDIVIRGKTTTTAGPASYHGVVVQGSTIIDAGEGAINITGESLDSYGVEFSLGATTASTLTSAKTSGTAIAITGITTAASTHGLVFDFGSPATENILATGGGDIAINGTATGTGYGVWLQATNVLATTGNISINGGSGGINVVDDSILGKDSGGAITSSSSDITLTGDRLGQNAPLAIDTTGAVVIQPFADNFSSAQTFGNNLTISNSATGLTMGKDLGAVAHTDSIDIANAIDIAGPINLYANDITLNADVTSSLSNADILLKASNNITQNANVDVSANGGDITLIADELTLAATSTLASSGALSIQPFADSTTIGLGGAAGTLQLLASYFSDIFSNGFSNIVIGSATGTGSISAAGLTASDNLTLLSDSGNIALTGHVNAGTNDLTLNTSGTITDTGAGQLTAAGLDLKGSSSVTLNNIANNANILAADSVGALTYVDADALTIGTVNASSGIDATGAVSVATQTGNLTLEQDVTTTDTSSSAIVLNAAASEAAGTATGGNIVISGNPNLTTGAGGTTKLYTGGVSGSTGLTALVGSGSGNFRYNSDESATNFTTALVADVINAIYREQPTITGSVDNVTITYGDAVVLSGSLAGSVNGDTVGYEVAAPVNSSSGNLAVSGAPYVIAAGINGLGYASTATDGALTVNQKALTLNGFDAAATKVYDGSTIAAIDNAGSLAGIVGGDTVTANNTGASYADKNVGAGKTVTLNGITLAGADAGNYSVANTATDTAAITAKLLTLMGFDAAATKVYDSTTTAAIDNAGTLAGIEIGDTVTANNTGASYADKNVGVGKTVTLNGITLAGADAGNYSVASTATDTAAITAKALTLLGFDAAATKVYDGGTVAMIDNAGSLTGIVGGESVTVSNTGASYADKNVGAGKTVTLNGVTLAGADAGNYSIASTATDTAAITAKALTLNGFDAAATKVYDGSTIAAIDNAGSLAGIVGGDTVTANNTGASYADKNVGAGKTVTLNGITLAGADAGNYSVANTATDTAAITAKLLTLMGFDAAATKVYDSTTTAAIDNAGTLAGIEIGDTVTANNTGASYADKNVGVGKTVTLNGITLAGADAGNYSVASTVTDTAAITAKILTLQGNIGVSKVYDGTTALPSANNAYGNLAGVVGSDVVNVGGTAVFDNANAGNRTITQGSVALTGGDAANYSLAWADGSGMIEQAMLTITADSDAKFVTQADQAGYAGVSYFGFVNGETSGVLGGALSIDRSNPAVNGAGVYNDALIASGQTSSNYAINYVAGDYTIVASNQLLVRVADVATTYGVDTQYVVTSAEYWDGAAAVNLLGITHNGNNNVTIADGVGGNATFTLAPSLAQSSASGALFAGNYQLGNIGIITEDSANFSNVVTILGNHTVNQKLITPDVLMASKTYNGTTTIDNIPFTGVGLLAGDAVSLGGTGNYTNKNAGANKTYTVDNMALLGADAANYLLAGGPSLLRNDGLITPKAVVVSGINASNKIYDGTTSADVNLTNLVFEGLISGDDLTAADTIGVFSDKNVGSNKTVNLVGTTYSGADAANYTISSQLSAAADITPKPLFLLGNTGVNKSFDGTADIVGGPAYGNLSGVINGEQVMLDGNAVYDSSIAGNRIVISGSLVLVGIDAANYSLAWSNGSGVISAKVSEQNAIASVTLPPNVPQPALPNPTNAPAIIAFEINENSFDGSSKSGSKAKSKVDGSDDNGNSDNSDEDCSPEKSTSGGDSSGASEPCGARLTPLISYNM